MSVNEWGVSIEGTEDFNEWEWTGDGVEAGNIKDAIHKISVSAAKVVDDAIRKNSMFNMEIKKDGVYFEIGIFEFNVTASVSLDALIAHWISGHSNRDGVIVMDNDAQEQVDILLSYLNAAIQSVKNAAFQGKWPSTNAP